MKPEVSITNRYHIIDKLGQGGMGAVWRVYDRLEKTKVALKQVLLSPGQLDFASKAGTDDIDKLRLSLAHEFSILATLRHPHILSVLDFGFDDDGHPFYTMTLLEAGQDVKSYAEDLTQDEQMRVLTQMLQALHYLHRRGILHRDLKTDNVLIDQDGQVKVMDFGIAKKDKDSHQSTEDDSISGTIRYMSPELFQGDKASVSSDLYAFGLMAYEILVGKYPFEFENIGMLIMKIMTETPDTSQLPDELELWMECLLNRDPDLRYQSAYDALQGLYFSRNLPVPPENQLIRESFLQASAFVGRESELEQLTDALDTIKTENAFFLIGGESGVGKSRLLDELRVRALVAGASVLRGQGVDGGGLPFQLWRNIVRRMVLMVEVTELQAGVLKDILPDVSELLGREIPDAPELTGKAYQERMVLAIVDLFRNLPQSVVLLLEDVQWTVESLAVLEQMLKVQEQLPNLMIVANYRDDEAPDLPQKLAGMTHIKLERLTPDAVSELSSAMLGEAGKNEEVVNLLHSQSEGNLFFLVETVRALAEASGDLQRIGQGELPEDVFTGGMQAITRRRLSKVDAQYSDVQMLAAVIGREIDTKLLSHTHEKVTVDAWLNNASDYGVVAIQDNTWRFAHDKLRETIIADIPNETLTQIHRTAAETIEAAYPDNKAYNEALLNHWHAAGDFDKELHYLEPVAKQLIDVQGIYAEAQSLLENALSRLPQDDGRRVALWNLLANSNSLLGNYEASQQYAEDAQQLATRLGDQKGLAASLNRLGLLVLDQGDSAHANDLFQQSLDICRQVGDQHGIARAIKNLGRIADFRGDYTRATGLYQQSLDICRQLGDQRGIADSLNNLGKSAYFRGDYARAADLFQQSMVIYQQLGAQRGIATSLNNLGGIALDQGEYARAADLFQQSMVLFQQLGAQAGVTHNLNNLGIIAYSRGDYIRAADLYQQSLAIRQQLGDQGGIAYTFNRLGEVALKQDDTQASQWFTKALKVANEINASSQIIASLIGFGGVYLQRGNIARTAELIGLAQSHPAKEAWLQPEIDGHLAQLEETLSPQELQAALERGKTLDLDTVVQELLAEFGSLEDDTP